MAEGFGRYWPREHARFLRIAKASLMETHNSARAGLKKGYFTSTDTNRKKMREALLGAIASRPDLERRVVVDIDPVSVL